jgi:ATP:cob(I)alamin adenosyltransferase
MYKKNIGSGDDGTTDFCGRRIKKTDDNLLLLSVIDEFNSFIGLVISKYDIDILRKIEDMNMSIMGFIAGYVDLEKIKQCISFVEDEIKKRNNIDIREFVKFNKNEKTSLLNIVRTKIRVAELYAWRVEQKDVAKYLNRLSDLIFLISLSEIV